MRAMESPPPCFFSCAIHRWWSDQRRGQEHLQELDPQKNQNQLWRALEVMDEATEEGAAPAALQLPGARWFSSWSVSLAVDKQKEQNVQNQL